MTTESRYQAIDNADYYKIADRCLLSPYNIDPSGLQQVLDQILAHEIDYADMYFQYNRSEGWMLEEGIVKSGSFNIEQGVGVRAISGDKTAFAYSDDISMNALEAAAKATRAISSQGGSRSVQVAANARIQEMPLLYLPEDPITSLRDTEKVLLLEKLERYARQLDSRVTQVMASLAGEYEVILVMRSDGMLAADVRPLVRVSVQVLVEENRRREQGVAGGGGRFDYAYFTEDVLRDYAAKAVQQAVTNLGARPAPAGAMTVVLGNGWPGILLHEAIGHGLEGDFNRKGSSAFSGRVGQRVAAPGVTVVDDGTLARRRGSLNIDDEGNPTQCTTLIEDGILKGYMQDSLNA
ncbi:MAG TPA: metallopeptidase TldD-related protein, partial [Nitrosomonas sp.]|nr:metallopeptidase TldD-related protein [Nitrosomonas sp.]